MKYKKGLIRRSEKVAEILKKLEIEIENKVTDGHIYQEDFNNLYMFLEFDENEEHHGR